MRKTAFVVMVFLMISPALFAQSSPVYQISELNWLEGRWERVMNNPNQSGFEEWEIKDEMLKGVGITLQQGDTVLVERLSIKAEDGDLYYVADVNPNTEPTYFKITVISETGFMSENPDHDFPKKIEYQQQKKEELIVTISGDERSIQFLFKKAMP